MRVCNDCNEAPPSVHMHASAVEVHAFEMDRCSHALLAKAFSRAGVAGVTVHQAAMTNQTGVAFTQQCTMPGNEGSTVRIPGAASTRGTAAGAGRSR